MPNKWTNEEEINLINMIKKKKSIKEISRELNRTENAVEQRINKIVYENIKNSGKTPKMIAGALNMPIEDVNSYYKGREDFLKQKIKSVAKDIGIKTNNIATASVPVEKQIDEPLIGGAKKKEVTISDNKKETLLSQLEYENRFIKALLENKILHKQLNTLIKDGNLDPNIKLLLKQIKNN